MWYSISMDAALETASTVGGYAQLLESYKDRINGVKTVCPGSGSVRTGLVRSLTEIVEELKEERSLFCGMAETLEECVSCYRSFETDIAKCQSGTKESGEEQEQSVSYWSWKDTWKMVSQVGVLGGVVSAVGNIVTSGFSVSSVLGSSKYAASVVGGVAGMLKGGTPKWGELVGLNDKLSSLAAKTDGTFGDTFQQSVKKQLTDDLSFTGAETTADKIKVGAKWAGYALTLASNAVDNYKEFEGQGTYGLVRGSTETVVETAVDIGLGIGATALVSAAAVAMGVAAPAILLGVASAGVVWAANGVCKWATGGRDIGEVVADAVCDVGEGAVALVKSGVEKVTETVKDLGDGIKAGVSTAWSTLCGVFG